MTGRPKLKIDRKYLNSFYYDRNYFQKVHNEFLFDSELKLLEIISKNNLTKMKDQDFEKFVKENLKLIKQCRYITNKKIKFETSIKYIAQKNKDSLNDEELIILEMLDYHIDISNPEYFYQYLDIYSSSLSQKIKAIKYQNIQTKNDLIAQEKTRIRKQQNHEKYFLGSVLKSLSNELTPHAEKNMNDVLIEMIKIYIALQASNRTNEFIQQFNQHQNLPVFNDIADRLALISQDPKNPFRKNKSDVPTSQNMLFDAYF